MADTVIDIEDSAEVVEEALCAVHQVVIEVGGGGKNRLSSVILSLQCPHQIKSHNLFKNCHKRLLIILSITKSFLQKMLLSLLLSFLTRSSSKAVLKLQFLVYHHHAF